MSDLKYTLGWDAVAVIVFVAVGRDSHDESTSLTGIVRTAAPFLIGLAIGWITTRAWRKPTAISTGTGVVTVTVAVGMLLRRFLGSGTALSFVFVATGFLGTMLLGWRGVAGFLRRSRAS